VREVLCDLLVVEGGPPFALKMRTSATTAATAAAAAAIASDPNAGDPIMNHVIAVVLRQPNGWSPSPGTEKGRNL